MILQGRFKFLGLQNGVTRDGKPYVIMGILQGFDSEKLYPDEEVIAKVRNIPPMSDIDCVLRINVSADKKAYINIDDVSLVK